MSTVTAATKNSFLFTCNCGWSRKVIDSEINFTCERPVSDANQTGCPYFYKQTHDGTSTGVPSVKRVNSAGVDQSDNAVVTSGLQGGTLPEPSAGNAHLSAPLIKTSFTTAHK